MKKNIYIKKKQAEEKILNDIYELKNYLYEPSEMPDFVMRHKHLNHQWGVEITSVFFHESSARLKKINNYALDLIEREKYKHKEDKELLKVETATLIREGKEVSKFKGIFSETPKIDNYLKIISDSIQRKNDDYQKYREGLSHINLIVYDEEKYFNSIDSKDFQKLFFRNNMSDTIVKSKFREIYFLTSIKELRKVFFPLKLMCFLSKLYKFNYMFEGFYDTNSKEKRHGQYFNYFIKYLYDFGMQDGYVLLINKHLSFYYAHSKIAFDNGRINIYEEPDLIIPSDAQSFNQVIYDVVLEKEFEKYLIEGDKKFSYLVDLCFDSKLNKKDIRQATVNEPKLVEG